MRRLLGASMVALMSAGVVLSGSTEDASAAPKKNKPGSSKKKKNPKTKAKMMHHEEFRIGLGSGGDKESRTLGRPTCLLSGLMGPIGRAGEDNDLRTSVSVTKSSSGRLKLGAFSRRRSNPMAKKGQVGASAVCYDLKQDMVPKLHQGHTRITALKITDYDADKPQHACNDRSEEIELAAEPHVEFLSGFWDLLRSRSDRVTIDGDKLKVRTCRRDSKRAAAHATSIRVSPGKSGVVHALPTTTATSGGGTVVKRMARTRDAFCGLVQVGGEVSTGLDRIRILTVNHEGNAYWALKVSSKPKGYVTATAKCVWYDQLAAEKRAAPKRAKRRRRRGG